MIANESPPMADIARSSHLSIRQGMTEMERPAEQIQGRGQY